MAHWQFQDGARVSIAGYRLMAVVLAWAFEHDRAVPESLTSVDFDWFSRLYMVWFHAKHGRLPSSDGYNRMSAAFNYPRLALIARLHDGPWWALDTWHPRCDPRIPLRDREPAAYEGCSPGRAQIPWVRDAAKWMLGTMLESGTLTWGTIIGRYALSLVRFDRWLTTLDDPTVVVRDSAQAGARAAAFRHWTSDPANRANVPGKNTAGTGARRMNSDLHVVAELMLFMLDNRSEARRLLGPSPWDDLSEAHPAAWARQISRERWSPQLVQETHYVDDHTLAQITACLPALGLPQGQTMIARVNGEDRTLAAHGDPQAMRMLLLQILTGRRASEICLCDFNCLSPATGRALEAAEGEEVARFRYGQSKIDQAPDTILVDAEVVAVIEEQRCWIGENFPGVQPRYLFLQRTANVYGTKAYGRSNYNRALRGFSETAQVSDSHGKAVRLSHTHRFRHTKLTRLAELGLPVHVLQRYAGHANPTMAMHYVARREEHAEQAFLATRKFKADGTMMTLSREDHDGMHLFDRADRFLPNGYCLLPPLQRCDKGNACLTCGVFVTDTTHLDSLNRQLNETIALIERTTAQFEKRHGKPMPDDNVWLIERTTERDALLRLLAAMRASPGRAVQGAGSPTNGPTLVTIDLTRHRTTP
jgi:Phage integrase family